MWSIKRNMQDYIGNCYLDNGVKFQRSTYWTLFGKNDHNLVRNNIKIAKENSKGANKPLLSSMQAGIIRDGISFDDVKSLDTNKSMPSCIENEQDYNKTQQLKGKTYVKTNTASDNGFTNYLTLILFIGLIIGVSFLYFLTR